MYAPLLQKPFPLFFFFSGFYSQLRIAHPLRCLQRHLCNRTARSASDKPACAAPNSYCEMGRLKMQGSKKQNNEMV